MLTFEQIKELVELVSQRGLGSLEIERTGFRLRIDARPAPGIASSGEAARAVAALEPAAVAGPAAPSPTTTPAATAAPAPAEAHVLTSPIVGTFYSAPSPDSAPFVLVGARVRKGQVVCIVEAMKLMNEIESDVDGMVINIFPQNAQPVEFGEPLFAIQES